VVIESGIKTNGAEVLSFKLGNEVIILNIGTA
jgi:hypothetical protein